MGCVHKIRKIVMGTSVWSFVLKEDCCLDEYVRRQQSQERKKRNDTASVKRRLRCLECTNVLDARLWVVRGLVVVMGCVFVVV